jgi:hypothetical protein
VSTAIEPLEASCWPVAADALAPAVEVGDGAPPDGADDGVAWLVGVGPAHAAMIAAITMAALPLSHLMT